MKYPWHLEIGDNAWIGERAWIEQPLQVRLAPMRSYPKAPTSALANHDWSDPGMGLVVQAGHGGGRGLGRSLHQGCPGVTVGRAAIVTLGSVLLQDAEERGVYHREPGRAGAGTNHSGPARLRPGTDPQRPALG